jgi:hypothetical protein
VIDMMENGNTVATTSVERADSDQIADTGG